MGANISWCKSIGETPVIDYIKSCDNKTLISVGSGRGSLEHKIKTALNIDVICIDPSPESFQGQSSDIEIKPDFSYVNDLIEFEPKFVNNCNLLLCWPLPNDSQYDISAIIDLKPQNIILIYETTGGSGGTVLLNWLKTIPGIPEENSIWIKNIDSSNQELYNLALKLKYNYVKHISAPDHINSRNNQVLHLKIDELMK